MVKQLNSVTHEISTYKFKNQIDFMISKENQ